jgi:hypothetical protein
MVSKLGLKALIVLGVIAGTVVFDPSDAQAFFRRRRAYSSGASYSSDCGCNAGAAMTSQQYQASPQYAEKAGSTQYAEKAGSAQYAERTSGDHRDNQNRESNRTNREEPQGQAQHDDQQRPPAVREEQERIRTETRSSDSKSGSSN